MMNLQPDQHHVHKKPICQTEGPVIQGGQHTGMLSRMEVLLESLGTATSQSGSWARARLSGALVCLGVMGPSDWESSQVEES